MIIVIGGGALREMQDINRMIADKLQNIREKQGRKPIALFLPQASGESKPYVNSFYKEFGGNLKCKATCALWANGEMDYEHIKEKMQLADMVYIGGGKYDQLLAAFEIMNMRELLRESYLAGKLIVGNSAGAMVLYTGAISDYLILSGTSESHAIVDGYGLIPGILCPHAEESTRLKFISQNAINNVTLLESNEYLEIN